MVKALPLLLLLPAGCGYLTQRGEDFLDIWKAEVKATVGLASVEVGPIAHEGLGAEDLSLFGFTPVGWRYGYGIDMPSSHKFPVQVYGVFFHVTQSGGGYSGPDHHQCFVLLPPLLSTEGIHQNVLHDFDFEVGAGLLLGFTFGFSLGEFVDFLLGWFGLDIAGDDDAAAREARKKPEAYFRAKAGAGPVLPKKDPP